MATTPLWSPDRKDMIWISFSPQAGREMRDEHPMLVLSTKAFNERTGLVIGLAMTTAASNETNPFALKYVGPKGEVGYVLTHMVNTFDWRTRGARPHPWKQVSASVFKEASDGLDDIINIG